MINKLSTRLLLRALFASGLVFALAYQIHAQSSPAQYPTLAPTASNTDPNSPSTADVLTTPTPSTSTDSLLTPAASNSDSTSSSTADVLATHTPSTSPDSTPTPTASDTATTLPSAVDAFASPTVSVAPAGNVNTFYLSDLADHRDEAAQLKAKLFSPEALDDTFHHHSKDIFLSPDRQFLAVTTEPLGEDGQILTYIADINGHELTASYNGSFISWSPDSKKVLLFLDGFQNPGGRRIYYLDSNDSYTDSGLPAGVISADISPLDDSIVYSLTSGGTDNSDLYLRTPNGEDKLLFKGGDNILAWMRFSRDGKTIAFMKSDLGILPGNQSVWTINSDGTEASMISDINWDYPPVWSPDGSKLAFANSANIDEYDVLQKSTRSITNFDSGNAVHPEYSSDGQTVLFSSDVSGKNSTWAAANRSVLQLTDGDSEGHYPVLP
jgi:Tol biopolymer transport system component